jgi:hypothetical protein
MKLALLGVVGCCVAGANLASAQPAHLQPGAIGVFHQPLWILILAVFMPIAIIALELPHGVTERFGLARLPPCPPPS